MNVIAGRYTSKGSWREFDRIGIVAVHDKEGREGLCLSYGRGQKLKSSEINHFYKLALLKQNEGGSDYLIEEIVHGETYVDVFLFPRKLPYADFSVTLIKRFFQRYKKGNKNALFSYFDAKPEYNLIDGLPCVPLTAVILAFCFLILRWLFESNLFRHLNRLTIFIMFIVLIPYVKGILSGQKESQELVQTATCVLFGHSDEVYWQYSDQR